MQIAGRRGTQDEFYSEVGPTDEQTVEKALNSSMKDFEDALQYFGATESECEIIITRNGKDFKKSLLPVMTAKEFLSSLTRK